MDSHRPRTTRRLGFGLFALAAGLAANSLLGPLVFEVIEYRFSTTLINQGIGLDAVALFGVAPLAAIAGYLVLRGHPAGPVLGFAPATFTAYMAPQYVIGPDYLGLPGNNEQFFVFHLALFVLAVGVIFGAWRSVDRDRLRPETSSSDRRRSWVLLGVAAFIALGRWLPSIIELLAGSPTNTEYLENPTSFLLIGLLDLGLVVPAALAGAVALRRGLPWARSAAYAVIGWFAVAPASVAAMSVTMVVNDDPQANTALMAMFVVAAVVFTLGAVILYAPMLRSRRL